MFSNEKNKCSLRRRKGRLLKLHLISRILIFCQHVLQTWMCMVFRVLILRYVDDSAADEANWKPNIFYVSYWLLSSCYFPLGLYSLDSKSEL